MKKLFDIKKAKTGEIVIITDDERPKENTKTFLEGLNGDWFWCSIYNDIARTGDITSYDFKIIGSFPKLENVPLISYDFIGEWIQNPVSKVEIECYAGKAVNKDGVIVPYIDLNEDNGDNLIHIPKINFIDEIICSIPKSKLDLNILEQKVNWALEKETDESLRNWLLDKRALEDEQILENEIKEAGENYCVDFSSMERQLIRIGFLNGAKSEAAKNYWSFKLEDYFRDAFKKGNDSANMPDSWSYSMEQYFKEWFTKTFKNEK